MMTSTSTAALFSLRPAPPTLLLSSPSTSRFPKTLTLTFSSPLRLQHLRPPRFGDDADADASDFPGADYFDDEVEDADNDIDYEIEYDKVLIDDGHAASAAAKDSDALLLAPLSSGGFVSTLGWEADTLVNYRINEEEFHKITLWDCDFFIRKVPDPDDDLYDFREMYVSPPDTDVYSIPKVLAPMPKQLLRCAKKEYMLFNTTEPPVDGPRSPLYKTDRQVLKVFLTKHYENRRLSDDGFVLDFEEIYVIDSKERSITRAKVTVTVPGGKNRDRRRDLLTIRDNGTSFKIIDESEKDDPQTVITKLEWNRTRGDMEKYLRKFRDFEQSNWF